MPQLGGLSFIQLRDSLPKILPAIADALASDDPKQIAHLLKVSPGQGLTRFAQHYNLVEIMEEDRLMRAVLVIQLESTLARQLTSPEAAALHATVDLMLQQGALALVEKQNR